MAAEGTHTAVDCISFPAVEAVEAAEAADAAVNVVERWLRIWVARADVLDEWLAFRARVSRRSRSYAPVADAALVADAAPEADAALVADDDPVDVPRPQNCYLLLASSPDRSLLLIHCLSSVRLSARAPPPLTALHAKRPLLHRHSYYRPSLLYTPPKQHSILVLLTTNILFFHPFSSFAHPISIFVLQPKTITTRSLRDSEIQDFRVGKDEKSVAEVVIQDEAEKKGVTRKKK